jgi:heptosyltransferase-2/heptosyltransferase-3
MKRRYKIINRRKLRLVRALDLLLDAGPGLLHWGGDGDGPPGPLPERVERILVVRLAYAGDVLLTLPVFAPLRRRFPAARITLLTCRLAARLLEACDGPDEVLEFDAPWFFGKRGDPWPAVPSLVRRLRQERFELGIDFRADVRNILFTLYLPRIPCRVSYVSGGGAALLTHPVVWSEWKHKAEFHLDILRGVGIPCSLQPPELHPSESWARELEPFGLPEPGGPERLVVVHPGARVPLKRWPATRFRRLVAQLLGRDEVHIAVTGSADEVELCAAVAAQLPEHRVRQLAGRLTVQGLAALLARAGLLITNDSMPMHLGAAVGTPVVAIFGPSKPRETAPLGEGHRVVAADYPCRYTCDELRCLNNRQQACMEAIRVEDVLRAVDHLLS